MTPLGSVISVILNGVSLKLVISLIRICQPPFQSKPAAGEDLKTTMMRHLFRKFKENSPVHNTVTGLSERAEGLLTKAVEIW